MPTLSLTLLGGFEARLATAATLALPTKKAQALLAYLALRPGQAQRRDKLAALLWGERDDEQARGALRHAVAALRRAMSTAAPGALRIEGQALALDLVGVEVDVVAFECAVAAGTPEALERAAEMYRGDLLLGFAVNEPLFEEWLVSERERLREMALHTLGRVLAHHAAGPTTERAIQTAVRLLALDPLQEPVHRTLMRLYGRQGRRGAALKQYQVCVSVLQRELGTGPEPETRRLYQELLRSRDAAAGAAEDPSDAPPTATARAPRAVLELPPTETSLFGRAAEMGRLVELLDDAIAGRGHVVTVVGEAGIGKTRLIGAVCADALARGCRLLIGRCHESDSVLPFGPWVDACRTGDLGADDAIGALHPARRAELARLLPEVGTAGLPAASGGALSLFESVTELVAQLAARQPVVLVLEDLHWADEMSLRLLAFVARRAPAWRVLVIGTAREEELPPASMARDTIEQLSHSSAATPIVLSPLSRSDAARLVRALARVGSDAVMLARAEAQIWAMSEGNPFVVVEAVRALDSGAVSAGPPDAAARSLPARVRELVGRRLDRLGPRGQQLTAVAAVIGRQFDFGLLRSASGMEERDAAEGIDEMVRHRVLQAVGDQLDFAHDRIRDVAYGRLIQPRRRLLHRAVAEALETVRGDGALASGNQLVEHVEQLAHHALRGDLPDKAVRYLRLAGNKAAARSALHEANACFARALDVLAQMPDTRSNLEQAFDARLELRPVLIQLGEYERALAYLREAEALAERLNDERRRGRVGAFMTNILSRLDRPGEAIASGTGALAIADRAGDLELRIVATTYLAQAYYYRGEYARVVELATANLAALPPDWAHEFFGGSQPPAVNDRFRLLVSLAHLGRFAEAAAHEPEVIRLAEATRHPYTMGLAYHAAATLHLVRGAWAEAHAHGERQISALRTGNIAGELPTALAHSAHALARLGDVARAFARLEEAEALLDGHAASGRFGNGWAYCSLGRAYLLLGRADDARRFGHRAIEAASGRVDFVPDALHLLGDVASHAHAFDPDAAEMRYREALAHAIPRGMCPLIAHCRLGLGRLWARSGKGHEAAEALDIAAALYGEMRMASWHAQARAERSALS